MTGLYFEYRNKEYFLKTNETRRTKNIIRRFLIELLKDTGKNTGLCENILNNPNDYKYLHNSIMPATLEKRTLTNDHYYCIFGKNFSYSYPSDEFTVKILEG